MKYRLWSRSVELDLWLCGLIDLTLCNGEAFLEEILKLHRQVEDVASVLVVVPRIAPDV